MSFEDNYFNYLKEKKIREAKKMIKKYEENPPGEEGSYLRTLATIRYNMYKDLLKKYEEKGSE